jgi:hypothetical protein
MPKGLNKQRMYNPDPPDPRFPGPAQFDLIVEGSSLDKCAREGARLRCIDIDLNNVEILNGDVVVIERCKGGEIELLGKRALRQGEALELWSESTNDFWREPVIRYDRLESCREDLRIIAKILYAY